MSIQHKNESDSDRVIAAIITRSNDKHTLVVERTLYLNPVAIAATDQVLAPVLLGEAPRMLLVGLRVQSLRLCTSQEESNKKKTSEDDE